MAIYLTSDWHFGHDKDFIWSPRGCDNVEENIKKIIENHNSIITNDDDVYVLGDLMLGNNEYGIKYINQMNGRLHIILGNHDSQTRVDLYQSLPHLIEICEAKTIKVKKQYYFLCHYPTFTANYDDKPYHSHLINLYGHTHQRNKFFIIGKEENPFMYNVGVDAHNCYPVSIEQIDEDIHNKINELYQKKIRLTK